jgi:hypothetical protein
LTVNFGAPNVFIALWFELDYVTNPPLSTLMIQQVHLRMCILKCCVLQENMDERDGVTTSSKEQMRSFVRVRVQGEITSKGGKDQGAMTDHPRGLRHIVRTSYEKNPYLDRGDDDLIMTQIKGAKSKMPR